MKLIEPNVNYKKSYLAMLQEWERHENYREQSPFPLSYDTTDFQAFISRI
jgi:predicted acetyltransferase